MSQVCENENESIKSQKQKKKMVSLQSSNFGFERTTVWRSKVK